MIMLGLCIYDLTIWFQNVDLIQITLLTISVAITNDA